ncbi:MAG TPA: SusC/RagA family TonB-linked outer membrane protein, partial [Flavisolibacter sp.]|nr:SusC/RagA family TonB-linked outer membrane protein [Flavisolibacter sp.]
NTIVATDRAGRFSILAKENDVLVFSMVGYSSAEIAAASASVVTLRSNTIALGEVVVVGYGTRLRKDLSSSIVSIKGEELRKSPVATLDQALQGRAAGVQVTSSTGDPGGAISVRIRGISTASPSGSSDPLYVVDDIVQPGGISFLNPSDIESIDILKDASALAIYGVRSANGVILIKTKRGSSGARAKVTLDAFTGVSKIWRKLDVLSIQEKAALNTEIIKGFNDRFDDNPAFTPIPVNPEWASPERIANLPRTGTDWQDEIFQTGNVRDVTLGVSGGGKGSSYYFSVGNRSDEGTIINSKFNRTSIRANVEADATDWLRVGLNTSYSTSNRRVTSGTNDDRTGFMQGALFSSPDIPVYNANGGFGIAPAPNIYWYGNLYNPVNIISSSNPKYTDNNIYGSVFGQIKLPFKITLRSTFAAGQFSGAYSVFSGSQVGGAAAPRPNTSLFAGEYSGMNWNWDNYITWANRFKDHNVEVTGGYVAQLITSRGTNYSQSNFLDQSPNFQYPGLGDPATLSFPFSAPSEIAYYSYFGRASYNFNEKYYFQVSARRDAGSPAYVTNEPAGTFPAASVKWRVSKERFFESIPAFSELSVRASYGEMGNIGNTPYPGYSLVKINSNYPFNGNSVSGVSLGQFPSVTGSTWERLRQTDIGLDASLFSNKVTVTLDWYNRITTGMRVVPKMRPIFGVSATPPLVNLDGDNVKNSGFEAAISYTAKKGKFGYTISGNASVNKNKILNLGDMDFISPPDASLVGSYQPSRTLVGHPISAFYGFVFDGIYQSQDEIDKAPVDKVGQQLQPGDMRFKDLNGDGSIDESDRQVLGNPTPSFTYGVNFSANYSSFDLSLLVQGVAGNDIYNYLYQQGTLGDPRYNEGINRLTDVNKRWTAANPSSSFPRLSFRDNDYAKNTRFSDFWLQSGAYLRLKNVQLGYSLPKSISDRMHIERFRVYVSASNLLTFTDYKGFDPEIGINSTGYTDVFSANRDLQLGIDRGVYPQPRMILFGVNVGF